LPLNFPPKALVVKKITPKHQNNTPNPNGPTKTLSQAKLQAKPQQFINLAIFLVHHFGMVKRDPFFGKPVGKVTNPTNWG